MKILQELPSLERLSVGVTNPENEDLLGKATETKSKLTETDGRKKQ